MAKSKYPDKLDTSIEIPAVRDNIIEIGSDVLNSVRTAIFQIERTLGINPQGAVGNTVSDRLNKSLDGNGNILKEALDRANVLSGPVVDKDVSKNAAINESKLRLDYPTQLLQDEISQIISQLTIILTTLEELAVLLNAHVHPDATNRHYAKAITVEAIDSTGSEVGMVSVDVATAQDVFEQIFQSHINYDGSDISISNRSHEADQLFFDNEDVSAYTSAEDVQEAIEDVYEYTIGQLDIHQNKQHDNGILKSSVITSPKDSDEGVLLVKESGVNYSATSPSEIKQAVVVRFDDPPDTPEIEIKKSDILKITDNSGSTEYQIFKVNYSAGGSTIESVEVYGHFIERSSSVSVAKIYRNMNKEANHGGLLTTAREYQSITSTSYSNADIIQIANPDASTIISNHINPSEISLTNRYFNITVDDGNEIELDIYDGTAASQSLDTIIKNLNAQFSENALSVSAYRVDYDENKSPELALVHSIPSDTSSSHTLMVSRGSDDALDSLGLEKFEDTTINSGLGTAYYIQGKEYSSLGVKMAEIGLTLLSGTASVTSSLVDFEEYGIREGDLLVVSGSPSDDGTYVILQVTTSSLVVDRNQLSGNKWSGESDAETEFYIYKNSISLNQMEFDISGTGGANGSICDVFMDYNRNVFYNVRLEYGIEALPAGNSLISIVDFNGDVSSYEGTLLAEPDDAASPAYTILTLDDGPPIELKGVENQYIELKSGTHDITLLIYIEDSDNILTFFGSASDITIPILGHEGVNEEENMLLSRALFESGSARIAGAGAEFPRLFRKMRRGNISQKDLGTDAIYANQQRPLEETRSNGVIFGLRVSPSATSIDANDHYTIDIVPGVCYVKGKRFEINKKENLITGIVAAPTGPDNFFVAVDQWGSIVFAPADGVTCECPFDPSNYCILSSVEYDLATVVAIDLRLLINDLDLTVLNSITVSPQKGMGHFSKIGPALKYAKRFSKMFPKAGVPTVHLKSGVHKVVIDIGVEIASHTVADYRQASSNYGTWINFPVNITGEGHSTVLDIMKVYSDQDESHDDRADSGDPEHSGQLFIAGPGLTAASAPDGNTGVIDSGFISLSNFRMRLCEIRIYDASVKDGDGNKLNWGVKIDNVVFDKSEKSGWSVNNHVIAFYPIDTAGGDKVGNLIASNCQFLNSNIYLHSNYDASDFRNISILNNTFRGSGDGAEDGEDHYAVKTGGSGHIFGVRNSPAENNIEFRGNTIADHDSGSIAGGVTAYIDDSGIKPWGDRISRNLIVGGDIGIKTSSPGEMLHLKAIDGGSAFIKLEADPDDSSESGNAGIKMSQDGGDSNAQVRFEGEEGATYTNSVVNALCINNNLSGSNASVQIGTEDNMTLTVRDGKVGILTNDPTYDLEVNGQAWIYNNLQVDGTIYATLNDASAPSLIAYNADVYGMLNISSPTSSHQIGALNIAASDQPQIYINAGSGTETGDIATYCSTSTSTYNQLSIGCWDMAGAGSSLQGTDFHERIRVQMLQGRLEIFQANDDFNSGLRLHKYLSHGGSNGTDNTRWTISFRDLYGVTENVLAFHYYSSGAELGSTPDAGHTRAYIKNDVSVSDLDFTGQHRSISYESLYAKENIGHIVVSSGGYKNFEGLIDKPNINESLPVVELSKGRNDKRVFGVISDSEDSNLDTRIYSVGAFVSCFDKKEDDNRLIINSLGEGAIWVCNINGDLENGDYITSCEAPGLGMKQDDDLLHNYTVAKITQDCDFDLDSNNYDCVEFEFDGQIYKKAFVGCTYHCG